MGFKSIIIGTAGHIDHGKSALVKKLTGTDPDRFREEKQRGITLDLGFANYKYKGLNFSYVDVPGHEKLVRNMIAGATGTDMILFTIDAGEGIKPQTEEHAEIISFLNIKTIVVAITKSDLVEKVVLEKRRKEIQEFFGKYNFKNIKIINTSIFDDQSTENLKETIYLESLKIKKSNITDSFLMRIDRVFTLKGVGTVITGTSAAGSVKKNDTIEILPQKIQGKIKSIQIHSRETQIAEKGSRVALNLGGIKKSEVERGNIAAAQDIYNPTISFYASLIIFDSTDSEYRLKHNKTYSLFIGTFSTQAKIIFINKQHLKKSESGFCKIIMQGKYTPLFNEKFFIRSLSPQRTVAGGSVLSIYSFNLNKKDILKYLGLLSEENFYDAFQLLSRDLAKIHTLPALPQLTSMEESKTEDLLKKFFLLDGNKICSKTYMSTLTKEAKDKLMAEKNLNLGEYTNKLEPSDIFTEYLKNEIITFAKTKGFTFENNALFIKKKTEHEIIAEKIYTAMAKEISLSNVSNIAQALSVDEKTAKNALFILQNNNKIKKLDEKNYIRQDILDNFINSATEKAKKEGYIDISMAKEIINASRKILIPLLEQLDKSGKFTNINNKRYFNDRGGKTG